MEGKAGFQDASIFGKAGLQKVGKSDIQDSASASPLCPKCNSKKVWRDAKRYTKLGDEIQRWFCRDCDADSQTLKMSQKLEVRLNVLKGLNQSH